MPKSGDDVEQNVERIAAHSDVLKDAWQQTLDDIHAMADDRRAEGWDVAVTPGVDLAPVSADAGHDDRYGLVFVVPDNYADEFSEAFAAGEFPVYDTFRNEREGWVFLVVELRDPDSETAIFLAGNYELRHAAGMVANARENDGEMFTHVQTLDETHLGSFRHDGVEKFVPHADDIERYVEDFSVGTDDA